MNRDLIKPLLTNLPILHISRGCFDGRHFSSGAPPHPHPLFLVLANKTLARRVAITGLGKFDGMVLNAKIRGLLVADLCELLQYRRERALLPAAFVWGERNQTCYSKATQHAHRR